MPNWCEVTMSVEGEPSRVHAFMKQISSKSRGAIDFNRIIPEPSTKAEALEKYPDCVIQDAEDAKKHFLSWKGRDRWFNWYNWHVTYWGTKWNACESTTSDSLADVKKYMAEGCPSCCVNYFFETAWAAPIPVMLELIDMFPDLDINFAWAELGCWFAGVCGTNVLCSETSDSDEVKRICIEELGYDADYFEEQEEEEEEEASDADTSSAPAPAPSSSDVAVF